MGFNTRRGSIGIFGRDDEEQTPTFDPTNPYNEQPDPTMPEKPLNYTSPSPPPPLQQSPQPPTQPWWQGAAKAIDPNSVVREGEPLDPSYTSRPDSRLKPNTERPWSGRTPPVDRPMEMQQQQQQQRTIQSFDDLSQEERDAAMARVMELRKKRKYEVEREPWGRLGDIDLQEAKKRGITPQPWGRRPRQF